MRDAELGLLRFFYELCNDGPVCYIHPARYGDGGPIASLHSSSLELHDIVDWSTRVVDRRDVDTS